MARINLRTELYLILIAVVMIMIVGGVIVVRYTVQIEKNLSDLIDKNLNHFLLTEKLEISLINQKGYVTYYYLDNNPEWLKQLGQYRQIFKERLNEIKTLAETEQERLMIDQIERQYREYIELKDRVIELYSKGEKAAGLQLHNTVRDRFFDILSSCERCKELQKEKINRIRDLNKKNSQRLIGSVIFTVVVVAILVVLMMTILVSRIFDPLHKLALEANQEPVNKNDRDDLQVLSNNIKGLIREADLAQTKLQQNREILIQSEKLALVGKLAAGMAHSIRNPLTSVKMRLFSLDRALNLNESQKEDFDVIAEEIKRLDIIVQNFLEFSRPPKLIMLPLSLSTVVDQSLQLLEHRLKSYNVTIEVDRNGTLPEVNGDSEQLKEVLVNLIVNACESMESGGSIKIKEDCHLDERQEFARVQIIDSGPGIPNSIIHKVFQPFFSTKDDGTGLGLSIASRIIQDHSGFLLVASTDSQGTTFSILLPVLGEEI